MRLLLAMLLLAACGGPKVGESHTANGVIQEVQQGGMVLVIEHEEMEGFMEAMTMPFDVEKLSLSEKLKAGDEVRFTLTNKDGDWLITAIEKL